MTADSAYFEVRSAFELEARQVYVLTGTVLSGAVEAGMVAEFADRDRQLSRTISGVEYVDESTHGAALVCLTIACANSRDLEDLKKLPLRGATLQLFSVEKYPCPCCGFLTLAEAPPGTYDICPVCFWEDDQLQFHDPDFHGGANAMSLNEARRNYAAFQACDPRFTADVRPPNPDEVPTPHERG